jgi:oxalate decarboxylase/phosphoglucose isomerase-like protein (cupin superfamily)
MPQRPNYIINTDVAFKPLELIDVDRLRRAVAEQWFNQTLCRVNDCVVRLGVIHGDFHWHKHDDEDEFFYVVDGQLLIDLEDGRTFELSPNQGFTVPRGVVHRTRAPQRTAILMFEGAGVVPTGDE